jgi:hypothetical protein
MKRLISSWQEAAQHRFCDPFGRLETAQSDVITAFPQQPAAPSTRGGYFYHLTFLTPHANSNSTIPPPYRPQCAVMHIKSILSRSLRG